MNDKPKYEDLDIPCPLGLLRIASSSRMEDFSMITHEQELQIKNKMIEEKNDQIVKLEIEVERLCSECNEWRRRRDIEVVRAEEAEERADKSETEVECLRLELGYIANAQRKSFVSDREFRIWAQSRARNALEQKPGELAIKKG